MANKVFFNRISEYAGKNGGRVLLLFLLFLLAIYEFANAGFNTFAIICLSPGLILVVYFLFRWKMATFWSLIFINYFLQLKDSPLPSSIPMSLWDEMLELTLLAIALVDLREEPRFGRSVNLMLFAIMIWCGLLTLQVLNDTCGLGLNVAAWFTSFRLMGLHLVWILLVFSVYISSPSILINYLRFWALLSLFSAYWTWKQKNIGFTDIEYAWLYYGPGQVTHIINGGTLIRYFSTFSDVSASPGRVITRRPGIRAA